MPTCTYEKIHKCTKMDTFKIQNRQQSNIMAVDRTSEKKLLYCYDTSKNIEQDYIIEVYLECMAWEIVSNYREKEAFPIDL